MEEAATSSPGPLGLRLVVSLVLVAGLVGGAVAAARALAALRTPPAVSPSRTLPPLVRGMRVTRTDTTRWIHAYGTAVAPRTWRVTAEVGGRVLERAADLEPGDVIEAHGDVLPVLVELDTLDAKDRLARARAELLAVHAESARLVTVAVGLERRRVIAEQELAAAVRERDRVERLVPRTLSASDLDRERLQVQARHAAVELLRGQLDENASAEAALAHRQTVAERTVDLEQRAVDRGTVRAPSAGRVLARHVERGDVVQPGQTLIELVDLSHVEVPLRVPASAWSEIAHTARVRLRAPAAFAGVREVQALRRAPLADEASRTFTLYVGLEGTPVRAAVAPGLHVEAEIEGATATSVFAIPREAFLEGRLYLARPDGSVDGHAVHVIEPRPVDAEHRVDGPSLVREGLEDGDLVVLTNLESLEKGLRVRLALEPSEAAPREDAGPPTPDGP